MLRGLDIVCVGRVRVHVVPEADAKVSRSPVTAACGVEITRIPAVTASRTAMMRLISRKGELPSSESHLCHEPAASTRRSEGRATFLTALTVVPLRPPSTAYIRLRNDDLYRRQIRRAADRDQPRGWVRVDLRSGNG